MTVNTSALSKLYIGNVASSAVDTQGEYEALSLVQVGEIEDLGEFGDKAGIVNFTALNDRRVRKFKTSFDAGDLQLSLGFDHADSGQDALKAAKDSDFDYAFKVTLNDGSAGSPSHPTTFYFRAKVTSFVINVGSVENVVKATVGIAINSAILQIDAV